MFTMFLVESVLTYAERVKCNQQQKGVFHNVSTAIIYMCQYCSVSFQSFLLNHLLVTSSETAKKRQTIAFTLAKRTMFVYLFFLMLSSQAAQSWLQALNKYYSKGLNIVGFWKRKDDYLFITTCQSSLSNIFNCRNKCTYPSFQKRNLRIKITSCRSGKYMGKVSVILPWQ